MNPSLDEKKTSIPNDIALSEDMLWVFTGQGSLVSGAIRPLYEANTVFQTALNHSIDQLKEVIEIPLLPLLLDKDPSGLLKQTEYAQPLMTALQLAQVSMWQSRSLLPSRVVGHSIGEFAAAVVVGVMTPETALHLAAIRGRLMSECAPGGMLAVFTPVDMIRPLLPEDIAIAAENGPSMTVLSGPQSSLKILMEERLEGMDSILLPVSHAFHSPGMAPAAEAFRSWITINSLSIPRNIDFISTLTGTVETEKLRTAEYWVNQITHPVLFFKAMLTAFSLTPRLKTVVELGPTSTLIKMAQRFIKEQTVQWIPSIESLHYKSKRPLFRHVPLHWEKPIITQSSTEERVNISPFACLYETDWIPISHTNLSQALKTPCLLLSRNPLNFPLSEGWHSEIIEQTDRVSSSLSHTEWSTVILISDETDGDVEFGLHLLQTISKSIDLKTKEIVFVTVAMSHQGAGLWGLARTFRLEYPDIPIRCIACELGKIMESIHAIEKHPEEDELFLNQEGILHVPRMQRLNGKPSDGSSFKVHSDATYIISGGQGSLALLTAKFLVEKGAKYLMLLSRTPKPIDSVQELLDLTQQANIECLACDISHHEAVVNVQNWLFQHQWPVVDGILHTAGILTDGTLVNQSMEKLTAALAPKVQGALHLHSVFSPHGFFILFSSAAALFGSAGQASYAAANTILDSLAENWSSAGHPVLSIQWGAWSETGMAFRHHAVKRAETAGFGSISSALGMAILDHLFTLGKRGVVYASPMDWDQVTLTTPLVSTLKKLKPSSSLLGHYHIEDLRKIVHQAVEEALGKSVDEHVNLLDSGLDSLGSVSLRNQLVTKLKVQIPAGFLFDHPNIHSIVQYVSTLVSQETPTLHAASSPSPFPILVIGAGVGGLSFARQLEKKGIPVVVMEQTADVGGVWVRLANNTSKLQIDSPAYTFDSTYLPSTGDHRWESTFPSRSEILAGCKTIANTLTHPIYFNTTVERVIKTNDLEYEVHYKSNGEELRIRVAGVAAFTGGLHHPRNVSFPHEDLFEGYICLGISNDIPLSLFKDSSVVIIGHGAFAIENMRTALENGATHVTILCRQKQVVFSSFCNWLINSSKNVLPVTDIVDVMRPFYESCGLNIEDVPSLTKDKNGDWMLDQTTVPAGSDIYFLAQMLGKLTVLVDEVASFTPDTVITKTGRTIKADIFMKCLGSDTDTSIIQNIFGEESTIEGLWINGDPNLFTYNDGAQVPRKLKSLMCGSYAFFVQSFASAYLAFREDRIQFERALARIKTNSPHTTYEERILVALWDFVEPAKEIVSERTTETCPFEHFQQEREADWLRYSQLLGATLKEKKALWHLLQPTLSILQRRHPNRPMEARSEHPSWGSLSLFIQRRPRVLFLPGQGTNSRLARTLLEQTGWIDRSNLDFVILDAPYEMPAFTNEEQLRRIGLDGLVKTGLYDTTASYREWRAGFEMLFEWYHYGKDIQITEEYRNQWKATLEYVKEIAEYYGPFDGIAGFCEGATVASVILHLQARNENYGLRSAQFFIAMSPWRSPLHEQEGLFQSQQSLHIPMLQIIGDNDMEVFLEAAPHFRKDFEKVIEFHHNGQHVYPPFTPGIAYKLHQLLYANNLRIWDRSMELAGMSETK